MSKEVILTRDEFNKSSNYTVGETVKHLMEELQTIKPPNVNASDEQMAGMLNTFESLMYHHYLTTHANKVLVAAGLPTIAEIEAHRKIQTTKGGGGPASSRFPCQTESEAGRCPLAAGFPG